MLDLATIDLRSLCEALDDHSDQTSWWIDPATGAVEPWSDSFEESEEEHPADRGWTGIEPWPSSVGYGDMADFIGRVPDARARDLLERAIAGRGAFRRFKDTLFEFPDLREAWFRFRDVRAERRAIRWLADEELIADDEAEREIEARPDPDHTVLGRPFDAEEVARGVARDLKELYGERLRDVVLFGSWARGEGKYPDSDIDLIVVLDRVDSSWRESDAMDEIMWLNSFENLTVVTEIPVSEGDWRCGTLPVLRNARREGRSVL